MSLASQNLFTNSNPRIAWCSLKNNPLLKNPNFILSLPPSSSAKPPHFKFLKTQSLIHHKLQSFRINHSSLNASFESDKRYGADGLDLDTFLSVSEFLCLASSAVISVGVVLNSSFSSSQKPFLEWLGNRVFVWQSVLLVSGIVIGAVIRRRQWWRICAGFAKAGGSGVNLVGRIEKLEDDLRSSATIIRLLSRQLEKLGIRFRVTRKALKEPIAETAALAQKNSEATRALAAQEDILEKELGEIQRVLLAMQDQQEKQLELILAIAKAGKLWETNKLTSQDQNKSQTGNFTGEEEVKLNATDQIQTLA